MQPRRQPRTPVLAAISSWGLTRTSRSPTASTGCLPRRAAMVHRWASRRVGRTSPDRRAAGDSAIPSRRLGQPAGRTWARVEPGPAGRMTRPGPSTPSSSSWWGEGNQRLPGAVAERAGLRRGSSCASPDRPPPPPLAISSGPSSVVCHVFSRTAGFCTECEAVVERVRHPEELCGTYSEPGKGSESTFRRRWYSA